MSQFRKTGDYYISQWNGDDLNAGTDPTLPKKNPSAITVTTLTIIGSGQYTRPTPVNETRSFEGDGKVLMKEYNSGNVGTKTLKNLHFKDSTSPAVLNSTDCIYENGNYQCRGAKIRDLICGTCQIYSSSTGTMKNCFIDTTATPTNIHTTPLTYCYISKQSKYHFPTPLTGHQNNMINGLIALSESPSTYYESKKLIDGSPRPDANPLIPDIIDVWPDFYTQGNFSGDALIIDLYSKTVDPSSDLLKKSSVDGYIGGVKVGKKINLDEAGFTITKTGIDDSNPNFWKIATGFDFAKVRITGKVSDSLISAQTLDIRIPFNFDGDQAGNTTFNNNVPDAWNSRVTPDTKGEMPNRLTFEVRSSLLTNPIRDNAGDWDNDNLNSPTIAGQYYLMEYGEPMKHHVIAAVAYGNADANAINAAVKIPFNYRSLDIIITITNNRIIV